MTNAKEKKKIVLWLIVLAILAAAAFTRFHTTGNSIVRLFLMPNTGLGGRSGKQFDSRQNAMLTSMQASET